MQHTALSTAGLAGPSAASQSIREQVAVETLLRFDPLAVSALERDDLFYHLAKRAVDVILAAVALVLSAPIMGAIAVAIALDSRGPVIFRQQRIRGHRRTAGGFAYWQRTEFTCLKFRTMVHHADPAVHRDYIAAQIEAQATGSDEAGAVHKLSHDSRITRVGQFLRSTSLDELPQLVNVLRGEMSLVGPRPDLPYAVEMYKAGWYERLAALPGITGAWQVGGRSEVSYPGMIRLDIDYVRERSLRLDLTILLKTVPVVLTRRGAC